MAQMITYRGKWILTPGQALPKTGYVVCVDNKIQLVTRNKPDGKIMDYDGLICAGLVNAHTHLEFSDLKQPLGDSAMGFVEWIALVMDHRRSRDPARATATIQSGLGESAKAGVCAVGEISTQDWTSSVEPEIQVVDYRELVGFQEEQSGEINARAEVHLSGPQQANTACGLSPHAPYSINRRSLEFSVALSKSRDVPLAMHVAETEEELELLQDHRGPFFELLNRLEFWTESNFPRGTRPLDFLGILARSFRALVVHGNYLSKEEIRFIAENSDTLKLVFCPRTHAFFGHSTYPVAAVRECGLKLSIGTDSRASNPDLSIWKELEFIQEKFSQWSPLEIMEMGTINGATALGLENELGSIDPGKKASFCFAPPESDLVRAIVAG